MPMHQSISLCPFVFFPIVRATCGLVVVFPPPYTISSTNTSLKTVRVYRDASRVFGVEMHVQRFSSAAHLQTFYFCYIFPVQQTRPPTYMLYVKPRRPPPPPLRCTVYCLPMLYVIVKMYQVLFSGWQPQTILE